MQAFPREWKKKFSLSLAKESQDIQGIQGIQTLKGGRKLVPLGILAIFDLVMDWRSFPLQTLFRLMQGQLVLLLENTSEFDDKSIVSSIDDILLRQAFWKEDVDLENGALQRLEATSSEAAEVLRLHIIDILRVLLVDIEIALPKQSQK